VKAFGTLAFLTTDHWPLTPVLEMQIFHKLEDVPAVFGPSLVSVGNFDGVHRAHAHVLAEIVRRARPGGAKAVAVTFQPHPARILRPD
jgi:riboflavin kinase/FMN adenylyltransferase